MSTAATKPSGATTALADSQRSETRVLEPRFMSARQVADYLQINEKKVYALASEGKIPGTKVTGKWLFPRELVDQWLIESSHGGVLADRLIISGSDDPLLSRVLLRIANALEGRALVSYSATGTRVGLSLLSSARVDAAALHWGPYEQAHLRHPALIRGFPAHHQWVIVRAFKREQGLMVSPEMELGRDPLNSVFSKSRTWCVRQEGSGSQRFLQEILAERGMAPERLLSPQQSIPARSEREAASTVALGQAEAAPGARAAARESGLPFVAVGWEAFDIALHRRTYFRTLFQHVLDELKKPETQNVAQLLGGYDLSETGRLVWASQE